MTYFPIVTRSKAIPVTPVISASPDYSIGDCVGSKMELANAVRVGGGTTTLASLAVLDRAGQKPALEVLIFDSEPAAGTYTDNATPSFVTDGLKYIGKVSVVSTDYLLVDGRAFATVRTGIVLDADGSGTSLWALVIANSAYNANAVDDLKLTFGFLQD